MQVVGAVAPALSQPVEVLGEKAAALHNIVCICHFRPAAILSFSCNRECDGLCAAVGEFTQHAGREQDRIMRGL